MKLIAIAALAAVVGTTYAAPQLQRKRSIENKYITNVDEQQKSSSPLDQYLGLGLSNRKLEKDESMSMYHGEYFIEYYVRMICVVR